MTKRDRWTLRFQIVTWATAWVTVGIAVVHVHGQFLQVLSVTALFVLAETPSMRSIVTRWGRSDDDEGDPR